MESHSRHREIASSQDSRLSGLRRFCRIGAAPVNNPIRGIVYDARGPQ